MDATNTTILGLFVLLARIETRLGDMEDQMQRSNFNTDRRLSRIEDCLRRIERSSEGIEGRIEDMDSRFDEVDSKLEDIDTDMLTDGISDAIKEGFDELSKEGLDLTAMNHNSNIYLAIKDEQQRGNHIPWGDINLAEVPFPGGRKPTTLALPLLNNPSVIDSLSDNILLQYYRGYYPHKAVPESRDKRIKAIWKAIGWKLV
ncbi:hypothetical protein ARMSODRAFT_1088195 [Armillaria solidipes]|uniref:Mug135-like C-terminal domain-containing protein n=1 Tax=Armillaria solidipes TaxID=1076256 RepID=A0A2H3BLU7_9AGAR|nr:hypothetical protein ARMSODRAFT_1088195 [Armillaria solidipes]